MTLFRQALEIDPDYADAMVQLANSCAQRFDFEHDSIWLEHGANYARRAVSVAPDLPAAQLAAGRLELANDSHEIAIDHLNRAVELDPLGLEAYVYLADAYESVGETQAAGDTIARAIRTGPDDWLTYHRIGRFYYFERRDYERAAGYFQKVIELLPERGIGYSAYGGCLFQLGDRAGAREQLELAAEIGPGYFAVHNLGTLEFYEGNFDAAIKLYRNALEIDDTDYWAWIGLGEALRFGGGSQDEVRDAYQKAADQVAHQLETDPDNLEFRIDLASLQLQLDRSEAARRIISQLPLHDVTAPHLMFALAEIFEVLGDRTEALEWIERALQGGYPLHVIEDYAAFADLRSDPRFRTLAETHAAQTSTDTNGHKKEGEK
jgi:tetratricopeptide (TPR) repeat protein